MEKEEELERMLQSFAKHRARENREKARYRKKYPEKVAAIKKGYREKNWDKIAELQKLYYETHR